jgi:hypothetical protein
MTQRLKDIEDELIVNSSGVNGLNRYNGGSSVL